MEQSEKKDNSISVLFAGDYHIYGKYDKFITANPKHQLFDKTLTSLISSSDLSVFNLEDPISDIKQGVIKYGPHGVGSKESLYPIKKAGFNLATFATNHTYDMGDEGIVTTITECKNNGIDVVGAGLNIREAKNIYYRNINSIKIAVLNFTRIEYNIVTKNHGGANPLDTIDNTRDIIEAKTNSDFVFVVVHEGLDVQSIPYPNLVKQMRFYADMGADAIILHHSRVISGYEVYNETPIFYGIGNIIHLTDNKNEHEGLIVNFSVTSDKKLSFEIIPLELEKENVFVVKACGIREAEIIRKVNHLSEIIKCDKKLNKEWERFIITKKELYLSMILGHPRIIYRIARKLKLLSLYYRILNLNKKKYLSKLNLLQCVAHYDATKESLTKIIEGDHI